MSANEYVIDDLRVEDALDDERAQGMAVRVSFVITLLRGTVPTSPRPATGPEADLDDAVALLTQMLAGLAANVVWSAMPSPVRH